MMDTKTCGALIKQIHDELEKRTNNKLRASDLTMAQMGALLVLREQAQKQMSLKELERSLNVAQSTAAGIVSRLERKGFVEASGSSEDKRIKIVRITKKGEECCRNADDNMAIAEEELLSNLTDIERTTFLALLEKVRNSFK